ncbi:MAG TPA: long-chain fatty acid--CoA ligase [Vicinamibacterales bacterium]|mgnify:CR=1 FL=1|nr:long-chain fatty acid--CoA ligase [Vicinamibacterales bacterium]HPW19971.1 long-chain fatty acid--CoA ligase [Vicinamibacterales bacterium]
MLQPKPGHAAVRTFAELPFYLAERYDRPVLVRRCLADGFHEFSTRAFVSQTRALSLSLQEMGIGRGDRVGLICESRPEWSMADLAILASGAVNVPVYPTLAASQTQYILADAGVKAVVVSDDVQLAKLLGVSASLPALAAIIVIAPSQPLPDAGPGRPAVHAMPDAVRRGEALLAADPGLAAQHEARARSVEPGDVATIIYTSGTTGPPKGVVLTHANMLSNLWAANTAFGIDERDVPLSFLPLSHVFERVVLYLFLLVGATVTFAENLQTIARDLQRVRPTVMTGVPRVFEKFHHAVLDAVAAGPPLNRALFRWAMRVSTAIVRSRFEGRPAPLRAVVQRPAADALVLRKIRRRLGGRLRTAVSGSAQLARTTEEFLFAVGVPIYNCYGLTECSPGVTVNPRHAPRPGTVGVAIPDVDVRIADDGEILVRGPNIMQGYYNRPGETADAIRGGWLHTGDIGRLDADGYLTITDRKKDIIVTSGGKNIAPAPIEQRLTSSPLVAEAVLVGEARSYPAALIVPNFALLEERLRAQGAASGTKAQLIERPDVLALYADLLDAVNVDLAQFEKIKRFALLPRELSIEGGELTPTMKVRRKVVEQEWADVVERLYAHQPSPARA